MSSIHRWRLLIYFFLFCPLIAISLMFKEFNLCIAALALLSVCHNSLRGELTIGGARIEVSRSAQSKLDAARAKLLEGHISESRDMAAAVVAEFVELPHADVLVSLWLNEIGQVPASMQLLEQLSKSEGERPDVHYGFAEVARKSGRSYDAWTHLNVAESAPAPAAWSSKYADEFLRSILLSKALVSEQRGDWQAAHLIYTRLKDTGVTGPTIELGLGRAAFKLNDVVQAEAHFRELSKLAPDSYIVETLMAGLYSDQNNATETEAWLKKGETENAEHADRIRLEHAMWLLREQRAPEAVRLAQTALAEKSEFADKYALVRALALYMYEKYSEAELEFARLSQQDPSNLLIGNLLALSLVESPDEGKRARALQIATANAKAMPASMDALSTLAYIQFRLGDLPSAEQTAATILGRGGQLNRDSTYFLAQVLAKLGKNAEAESLLEATRTSSGEFFNARRLEKQSKLP